jgi:hypothetical protein
MALYNGFTGSSYTSQSPIADAERTVNWYLEILESQYGKSRQVMYPTPGFQSFLSTTDVGGRALATMNGRTFGVMGAGVYEVFTTQTSSRYGSVVQDNNPAQIAFNGIVGNQALFSSGNNAYNLNLTTNVLTLVLTNKATQIGMLDGYGIAFDTLTGRINVSNINDFTTWDPTQFAARSSAPDTWKAMLVNAPDIWLIGSLSGDVWYDAGTFPFPLAPRAGLNFKYGIVAPFSLAASGPSVMWLSNAPEGSGIVVRTRGYQPQRVSTYAVETAIAGYARTSRIDDAEAFVYQDQGHTAYVLNFPTANATHVYDMELNQWHERGYWNAPNNRYDAWKPRVHAFAFGQHLTADRSSNMIATMDISIGTELDGTPIRRLRRAPAIFSEHKQLLVRVLEVYLESGLATQSGNGSAPVGLIKTSDDGGKTWSKERQASAGLVGQYSARMRFTRMGISRDRLNEFVVSDPIPWRIVAAYINNDQRSTRLTAA